MTLRGLNTLCGIKTEMAGSVAYRASVMTGRGITQFCAEDNFGVSCRNDMNANTSTNLEKRWMRFHNNTKYEVFRLLGFSDILMNVLGGIGNIGSVKECLKFCKFASIE
jgi:hypothetical protein